VVIGLVLYLIDLIPMDRTIKQIIRIIVIIGVVVWLLQAFGFIGSINGSSTSRAPGQVIAAPRTCTWAPYARIGGPTGRNRR